MTSPRGPIRLADTPTLRLRQPADVLSAIPFLIGYHPQASAVIIGQRGKQLRFTLRIDLPPADLPARELTSLTREIAQRLRDHGANAAVLIGYGPDEAVRPMLRQLRRACRAVGIRITDSLRSHDGRYWSYQCRDPRCCPPGGTPYDAQASAIAAEAVLAGCTALPDFAAYADQIAREPVSDGVLAAAGRATNRLLELIDSAADEREAADRLVAAARSAHAEALGRVTSGAGLTDDDIAWLSTLALGHDARDWFGRQINGPRAAIRAERALWQDVMRRCEAELLAAPGMLFAFAAHCTGDTKLGGLALDRVIELHPGYRPAQLMHELLAGGVPPAVLRRYFDDRRPRPGSPARNRRKHDDQGPTPPATEPRRGRARAGRRRSSSRRAGNQPT